MIKSTNMKKIKWHIKKVVKTLIFQFIIFYNKYALYRNILSKRRALEAQIYIDKSNKKKYIDRWLKLGSRPLMIWYKTYKSVTGIDDPSYIPETDYYHKVELILNRKPLFYAYADKNNYHNIINNTLLPDVYLRNMDGVFYNRGYEVINSPINIFDHIPIDKERLIIKKTIGSCSGKSIQLFSKVNGKWINKSENELTTSYLDRNYTKDYILQELIVQHPFYKRFNETSVNTIRLFTYRSVRNNKIICLQALLRIGRNGAVVDNVNSGGICCGIDENGVLREYGLNKHGVKIFKFNNIVFKEVGMLLGFNEIKNIAEKIGLRFYYHRLLGFDFCIDENNNVKLIEVNLNDIGIRHQLLTGPLFREYTDEIIEYCSGNRKTISFDFDL